MPLYEALSERRSTRWIAYGIEAATPILLTAMLVFLVIFSVNTSANFDAQTKANRLVACNAVAASNDATVNYLRQRIASAPESQAQKDEGNSFVDGLAAAYDVVTTACKTGATP